MPKQRTLVTWRLVEEAFVLWRRLDFRQMLCMYRDDVGDRARIIRVKGRAMARYSRRKRAIGGMW